MEDSTKKETDKVLENFNADENEMHNRTLKFVLIGIVSIFILVLIIYLISLSVSHIQYNGTNFEIQKEGQIIIYKTVFPMYSITGNHVADYSIYLRKDPRKLKDIPVYGSINFLDNIVINMTDELSCNGDDIIAIANFVQSFGALGSKTIKDPNAACDSQGRYTFIQIQRGNETSIEQFGPSCYYFNVNNCEILDVTERFMLEKIIASQNQKIILNQ